MDGLIVVKFQNTVGAESETFTQEVPRDVPFFRLIGELARKIGMPAEDIIISVPGGSALTESEYKQSVGEITTRYKTTFTIINRGIVG